MPTTNPGAPRHDAMQETLDRNISALMARRAADERSATPGERLGSAISGLAGTMGFAVVHLALFAGWCVVNLGWIDGLPRFDPELVGLAVWASVEAMFISIFVLINQKRMAEADDRRADLNLQVSLMSEHESTRLLVLVAAIARRLDVQTGIDDEIRDLGRDLPPEEVLDELEQRETAADPAAGTASSSTTSGTVPAPG